MVEPDFYAQPTAAASFSQQFAHYRLYEPNPNLATVTKKYRAEARRAMARAERNGVTWVDIDSFAQRLANDAPLTRQHLRRATHLLVYGRDPP